MPTLEPTYQVLEDKVAEYAPDLDKARLKKAWEFAREAHEGQVRKSGIPYILHPLSAALILTELRVDVDTIIACLLHDVPEDTVRTIEEIGVLFGETVAFLVEGITKLSKVHYRNDMQMRQVESLHKLFIHSAKDPRVILIKLADRLHNMQTLDAISKPEKRQRIAKETLEVFVPVANLMGVWQLKIPLEDHCFRMLCPEEYKKIDELVRASDSRQKDFLKKTIQKIEGLTSSGAVNPVSIEGRQKSRYSIFKKMQRSRKSFNEIYDLIGVRVILPNVGACYQMLGILHQNFTPKIGRLKDYIAIPKSNGYQAIHTTLFGVDGKITEVQIRSHEMHLENEYGIAAHYFYRKGQDSEMNHKEKMGARSEWVEQILSVQREVNGSKDFLKNLKLDFFENRIFVFTPKGDVIDLPQGSNIIDFAYHIHTDIGMLAVSGKVNGQNKSLYYKLKSSDVVRVVTNEDAQGPRMDWLDQVKTHLAKNRIRSFLKEKDRSELIQTAEQCLDEKLQMYGQIRQRDLNDEQQLQALKTLKFDQWEMLLMEMGKGNLDVNEVICALFSEEELLGNAHAPNHVVAYERMPNSISRPNASELHYHDVKISMEVTDRIGLLSEVCTLLAKLQMNILENHSYSHPETRQVHLDFIIEVRNMEEFNRAYYALKQVQGVLKLKRIQIDSKPHLN